MKLRKISFFAGLVGAIIFCLSYFIFLTPDSGANYVVEDRLMGILIFHNFWIFLAYIAVFAALIFIGIRKK